MSSGSIHTACLIKAGECEGKPEPGCSEDELIDLSCFVSVFVRHAVLEGVRVRVRVCVCVCVCMCTYVTPGITQINTNCGSEYVHGQMHIHKPVHMPTHAHTQWWF